MEHTEGYLVTGGNDPFLPKLIDSLDRANEVDIAVSFIKSTGLELLIEALESFVVSPRFRRLRILTTDYLYVTDPQALRTLLVLSDSGVDVRIFETRGGSFHLKSYIFARESGGTITEGWAYVGSSNVTGIALTDGLEWNYRVEHADRRGAVVGGGFQEIRRQFELLFNHDYSVPLDYEWIRKYESERPGVPMRISPGSDDSELPIPEPNEIQQSALAALGKTRKAGFGRGLVVMATGLGKTYLAAFDARQCNANKVLFVAHREELLNQAGRTFVRIFPDAKVGAFTGKTKDGDADFLFASIQTIGRERHLEMFPPEYFDYIVVDEFHHAAASTYRRLLQHFRPRFLLGLTATPERTDQSDILSFCDDNLVYAFNLFDAINANLLSPFHYYGILDQTVDYQEIPWRSGKFDPETLSNRLATLNRAKHVLAEWKEKGSQRTLAFCVSTSHADFMADYFTAEGVAAAAVHSKSEVGRAEALGNLSSGRLRVIFSVDLFNEGIDVPNIDTVMMLRPTESKILFLQQLGRGLRKTAGKEFLTVLDFIGNHEAFLNKPCALFGIEPTYSQLAKFADDLERETLKLPSGCFVNYDLELIEFLKKLGRDSEANDYLALKADLGRRPTLAEFLRSGAAIKNVRSQYGGWFQLVQDQNDLSTEESRCLSLHGDFLRDMETTPMQKSFKMIVLETLLEQNGFAEPMSVSRLSEECRTLLSRRQEFRHDIPESFIPLSAVSSKKWETYWRQNPIAAFTGEFANSNRKTWFSEEGGRFVPTFAVREEDIASFAQMLQEVIDFRYAQYSSRTGEVDLMAAENTPRFDSGSGPVEVLMFPDIRIACGHYLAGTTGNESHVQITRSWDAQDQALRFIASASGESMNGGDRPVHSGDLMLLRRVDPDDYVEGDIVALERTTAGQKQYLLRQVHVADNERTVLHATNPAYEDIDKSPESEIVAVLERILDPLELNIGKSYSRPQVAELFGEKFKTGNWNNGHIVLEQKQVEILLVTLNKRGKPREHRYTDYFDDEGYFHWQSQAATIARSKRGRQIVDHAALGLRVHLFVRQNKLSEDTAAPFQYLGPVEYVRHEGEAPMNVVWRLLSGRTVSMGGSGEAK